MRTTDDFVDDGPDVVEARPGTCSTVEAERDDRSTSWDRVDTDEASIGGEPVTIARLVGSDEFVGEEHEAAQRPRETMSTTDARDMRLVPNRIVRTSRLSVRTPARRVAGGRGSGPT